MLYPLSYRRPSHGGPNDWTRIADLLGVADIGAPAHDREVIALTRALAGLLAGCLLAGCSLRDDGPDDAVATAPEVDEEPVSRPHFTGGLDVTLRTGRVVYNDGPCQSLAEDRVCDLDGEREYVLLDEAEPARLVEARMDPSGGNTAWTATVIFSPGDAPALRRQRELARATGALVLVLDEADQVLLLAPVPRVEGRRIVYPGLPKPDAWELVERIADG